MSGGIVGVGLIISVGLALCGTYVAFKAETLREALNKRDGGLLMNVIARFIQMTVLAMWVGIVRVSFILLDETGTAGLQVILQVFGTGLVLGTIVWSLVQVRGWNARIDDLEGTESQSRFLIELGLVDRMASKGDR